MRNDLHDDPKTVWQSQRTEASRMNLILIRQKARELHAKTRRQLMGAMTVPVAVAFFYAFCIKQFPHLQEMLHALFAFALAWSIAGLYFLNRGKWSGEMPADAGLRTGLEFCRREIQRRRDYFHRDLLWSFGPVILAIATLVVAIAVAAGPAILSKAIPFLTLVIAWIAAYLLIRARQQRELRRELDELSEIESENRR